MIRTDIPLLRTYLEPSEQIEVDRFSDEWRMPSVMELSTLVKMPGIQGSIPIWSGTSYRAGSLWYWTINFPKIKVKYKLYKYEQVLRSIFVHRHENKLYWTSIFQSDTYRGVQKRLKTVKNEDLNIMYRTPCIELMRV